MTIRDRAKIAAAIRQRARRRLGSSIDLAGDRGSSRVAVDLGDGKATARSGEAVRDDPSAGDEAASGREPTDF